MVFVEMTVRALFAAEWSAEGTMYARDIPTPVPASTSRLLCSASASPTARAISVCCGRSSNVSIASRAAADAMSCAAFSGGTTLRRGDGTTGRRGCSAATSAKRCRSGQSLAAEIRSASASSCGDDAAS